MSTVYNVYFATQLHTWYTIHEHVPHIGGKHTHKRRNGNKHNRTECVRACERGRASEDRQADERGGVGVPADE